MTRRKQRYLQDFNYNIEGDEDEENQKKKYMAVLLVAALTVSGAGRRFCRSAPSCRLRREKQLQ